MATTIDQGFSDAEIFNESPRSPHIFKDINLFFTRNPATNDVSKVTDIKDIKRSVLNLLRTEYNERLFHPEIGAGIRPLLFELFLFSENSLILVCSPCTSIFLYLKTIQLSLCHTWKLFLKF